MTAFLLIMEESGGTILPPLKLRRDNPAFADASAGLGLQSRGVMTRYAKAILLNSFTSRLHYTRFFDKEDFQNPALKV